jgi:hypothetical protein
MKSFTLLSEEVRVLIPVIDMQSDIADDVSTDALWKDLSEYAGHDNINITKIEFMAMRHNVNVAVDFASDLTNIRHTLYSNQNGGTFEFSDSLHNNMVIAISSHIHFLEDTIGDDTDQGISISDNAVKLAKVVNAFSKIK